MRIYQFELGPLDTNAYLIIPDSGGAILIDAPEGAAQTVSKVLEKENRKLEAILLTHCHWDHSWDAAELSKSTGAKIYAGEEGRALLENEGFQANYFSPQNMRTAKIDKFPKDGETLNISGLKIKCYEAPGHCPGSILYYIQDAGGGSLYAGDLIFQESVGRADLWGGDYSELKKSIRAKIYTLPGDTKIFPGHGPATSVAHEKANNPFVRGN